MDSNFKLVGMGLRERVFCFFIFIFLFMSLLFGRDILLLNSARDYFYLFSTSELKVKGKFSTCSRKASCTDIISNGKKYFLVLHRLGQHQDSNEIRVYNSEMSKLLKILYVEKSPYRAFRVYGSRFLINHTFFDFISKSFNAEILDINASKIVKNIPLDGIPVGVINFKGKKSILLEDVRGTIGGIEVSDFSGNKRYVFKNKFISSNISEINGKYFCAVNHYGKKYKNSLLRLYPFKNYCKVKVLKKFDIPDPAILGKYGNYLFIGFSNHSILNNYNRFGIYDIKSGDFFEYKTCFGPESVLVIDGKVFIGCVAEEKIAVIDLKTLNIKIIKISDLKPGFSVIRKVY